MNYIKNLMTVLAVIMLPTVFAACGDDDDPIKPDPVAPTVNIQIGESTENSVSFSITGEHVTALYYLVTESTADIPTMEQLRSEGTKVENVSATTSVDVTVDGLKEDTRYQLSLIADGEEGTFALKSQTVSTSSYGGTVYAEATGEKYGNSNYDVTLKDAAGNSLSLDMYCNGYKYLPDGTYTVGASEGQYISTNKSHSNYTKKDGQVYGLKTGSVDVKTDMEKKTYHMDATMTLDNDSVIRWRYEGAIEGIEVFDEWNIAPVACKRVDVRAPQPGEFYLRLNDSDWTFEMVLQLFGNASDSELQAGTYTFADTNAAGTMGAKTSIDTYSLPVSGGYIKSGKAVVSKTDNNYKIEMDLTAEDGQRYVGTFEGEITNMDLKD